MNNRNLDLPILLHIFRYADFGLLLKLLCVSREFNILCLEIIFLQETKQAIYFKKKFLYEYRDQDTSKVKQKAIHQAILNSEFSLKDRVNGLFLIASSQGSTISKVSEEDAKEARRLNSDRYRLFKSTFKSKKIIRSSVEPANENNEKSVKFDRIVDEIKSCKVNYAMNYGVFADKLKCLKNFSQAPTPTLKQIRDVVDIAKSNIGRKDVWRINSLLLEQLLTWAPYFKQDQIPIILTMIISCLDIEDPYTCKAALQLLNKISEKLTELQAVSILVPVLNTFNYSTDSYLLELNHATLEVLTSIFPFLPDVSRNVVLNKLLARLNLTNLSEKYATYLQMCVTIETTTSLWRLYDYFSEDKKNYLKEKVIEKIYTGTNFLFIKAEILNLIYLASASVTSEMLNSAFDALAHEYYCIKKAALEFFAVIIAKLEASRIEDLLWKSFGIVSKFSETSASIVFVQALLIDVIIKKKNPALNDRLLVKALNSLEVENGREENNRILAIIAALLPTINPFNIPLVLAKLQNFISTLWREFAIKNLAILLPLLNTDQIMTFLPKIIALLNTDHEFSVVNACEDLLSRLVLLDQIPNLATMLPTNQNTVSIRSFIRLFDGCKVQRQNLNLPLDHQYQHCQIVGLEEAPAEPAFKRILTPASGRY